MIEVQNIKEGNSESIFNLIEEEKEQPIRIYFPKYTILYSSSNENIAEDYARLAYVGHRLNEVSINLKYTVVPSHQHESILFEISSDNLQKLSEILLELSYLFENYPPEDEFIWDNVYQYISDVEENKIKAVCPEFLDIYKEFRFKNGSC